MMAGSGTPADPRLAPLPARFNSGCAGGGALPVTEWPFMSKKMLRVAVAELKTMRVRHVGCRSEATVEGPIDRIDQAYRGGRCPFCDEPVHESKDRQANLILELATAVEAMQRIASRFEVEFVLPDEEDEPVPAKPARRGK